MRLCRRALLRDSSEGHVVSESLAGGGVNSWSLTSAMRQSEQLVCTFGVGPTVAAHSIDLAVAKWPRQQFMMFWNCIGLYRACHMT